MSKPNDLKDLVVRKWGVKPLLNKRRDHVREVIGFDCESYKKGSDNEGKSVLITDSKGDYIKVRSIHDVFKFLMHRSYKNSYNFFFNLEYDTNALLKHLPEENINCLAVFNETRWGNIIIEIIPKKFLCFRRGRSIYRFYDISQFYQIGSLIDTYKRTFGEDYTKILDASTGFDYEEIDLEVIKYCVEDSQACQRLADNFVKACHNIAPVKRWYSPATLGKTVLRCNMSKGYKFNKSSLQNMALKSYAGGRIEVFKRGFFKRMFVYDINSAYPSIQSNLNAFGGNYWHNKKYEKGSGHSFFRINVEIPDCIVSPLKFRLYNMVLYPYGRLEDQYVSKVELECLMRHDISFEILEARHNDLCSRKPFGYMLDLYKRRLKYKNEGSPLQLPLKLALNSSYGILIERQKKTTRKEYNKDRVNDPKIEVFTENGKAFMLDYYYRTGAFFNPIWAAEITAGIRVKLYEDSIKYEDHILKYSTDSIAFDRKVKLPFSKNLGEYGDSVKYKGLIVGNGVYSLFDGKEYINRFRSFGKENVLDLAKEHKEVDFLNIIKESPRKLKESRHKIHEFNRFLPRSKKLDVNFDNKRVWDRRVKNFGDLLNTQMGSRPYETSALK